MNSLNGKSLDIVTENIARLKELFPEIVTEDKIDFAALKEVLGEFVDGRDERYSFTWNGKSKAKLLAQTPSTGTLRPCPEESVDWDTTKNIFIEGDNLEVLKLLQKSYYKKIKMIYIDPPYNTGKDFVYKDDFRDNIKNYKQITGQLDGEGKNITNNPETSGRYHTDWLNMMYPRLKLARNLLIDDGVIFVSIDDNELVNLKKIVDEIFGEENFLANLVWKKKYTGGKHTKGYVDLHEYILVYAKNINLLNNIEIERPDDEKLKFIEQDEFVKERGKFYVRPLKSNLALRKTLIYPIEAPDGSILETQWLVAKDTFEKLLTEKRVEFRLKQDGSYQIYKKYYEKDSGGTVKPPSLIEKFPNTEGKFELKSLFNIKEGRDNIFYTVKPVNLLSHLFDAHDNEEAIVLDFFVGSGTTAQVVFQKNLTGGNRRFIAVQLPEIIREEESDFKFVSDISKERIRRAAKKIKEENPDYEGDLGFKVFKLDSTNIKPWEADQNLDEKTLESYIDNIKADRSESDVLYEILLKYGLDLTLPIKEHMLAGQKVFDIGMGALLVCLGNEITPALADEIVKLYKELAPEVVRVILRDSGFKDDVAKTNVVQILKQADIQHIRSL
ncbi:MAG: site-specific DNA-methyltransferase [Erysipelotrichia bacterium]|nr:site-specific DNA-methyltransferase [Erysipelotrichia bacterium]